MKIFSTPHFLIVLSVCFIGCQKKSDPAPTKADHISSSAWKYESGGIDGDKNGTIDFSFSSANVPACYSDNTILFNKNQTGVTNEGATKCNASDPQTSPFTWSFADNQTNLTISGNVFPLLNGRFKVLTLTSTNFSLSKDTVMASQNVALIVNLVH